MNPLDFLLHQSDTQPDLWVWATVTATNPLQIILDGETLPLAGSPDSLVDPESLGVGVRVRVHLERARGLQQLAARALIVAAKQTSSSSGSPTGTVTAFAGTTAPNGWLLCQGQAVSRTEYAGLFTVIGTTYGVGDGSTTFNVPNLKGRVAAGFDTSQSDFNALGKTGGAKTHTLTTAEMPEHNHPGTGGLNFAMLGDGTQGLRSTPTVGISQGTATGKTGGGGAHNNLQPYISLNYIIKV